MSLQQFLEKWGYSDAPSEAATEADLDAVEVRFGFTLPKDYRREILACGIPTVSGDLLDGMLAAELTFPDVSSFFTPEAILRLTEDWRGGGMPGHLVGIAFDCGGSLFCFDAGSGSPAVLFWNHNNGQTSVTADSFTAWIERFAAVEPAPEGWEP